jgi:hypothetical protein
VWFVVVCIATLALFNYPRTWVQELITETSLLWAPLCVVGITVQLCSFRRASFSLLGVVLFALQVMCVVRTVHVVAPYVYAAPKTYSDLSYAAPVRFLMVDISDRSWTAPPKALTSLIDAEKPSVVVILRYGTNTALLKLTERYSFTVTSSVQSDRTIEIFSKLPVQLPVRTEVGYGALPAILGVVETGDGAHLQLGAVDLLPAYSQDAFVKSRLTSRRLASSLKYSTEPRMVMGAFRASITSQVVDMYVDQLRLRSVFFDSGLAKLRELVCQSLLFEQNLNVFAAGNIEMFHVVEQHGASDGFSAILFDARIPQTPIQASLLLK